MLDLIDQFFDRDFTPKNYCVPIGLTSLTPSLILCENTQMINFASADVFGLSLHPELKKNSMRFILQEGTGITSNPSPYASLECERVVEEKMAHLLGTESALFFPSRFHAQIALFFALATPRSIVFLDSSCHIGLLHGATASRCRLIRYTHNDLDHLEDLLRATENDPCDRRIVATETLFSQEGDLCDVENLLECTGRHNATLILDEAHAFGTMGHEGLGLGAGKQGIDFLIGSFSKAAGCSGAYVGCSFKMKQLLMQQCPSWKDRALQPGALGAIAATLDLIPQLEGERMQLKQRSYSFHRALRENGFITSSMSHIIPILLENSDAVEMLHRNLKEAGFLAEPLIGSPRIRFNINMHHTAEELSKCCAALLAFTTHSFTEAPRK